MWCVGVYDKTGPKLAGLTQSFVEQTEQKVKPFTVDGKYNQSGFTVTLLYCRLNNPPFPPGSMLGDPGWVEFLF